jgi:hypothetical protein
MKNFVYLVLLIGLVACATPQQLEAQASQRSAMMAAISQNSTLKCGSKDSCDKIFRVASDVVVQYSDMKIQTQGVNNISSYNPIKYGYVGMSAQRVMTGNNAENITLNVNCKGMFDDTMGKYCYERVTSIYQAYKARVDAISADDKPKKKTK